MKEGTHSNDRICAIRQGCSRCDAANSLWQELFGGKVSSHDLHSDGIVSRTVLNKTMKQIAKKGIESLVHLQDAN